MGGGWMPRWMGRLPKVVDKMVDKVVDELRMKTSCGQMTFLKFSQEISRPAVMWRTAREAPLAERGVFAFGGRKINVTLQLRFFQNQMRHACRSGIRNQAEVPHRHRYSHRYGISRLSLSSCRLSVPAALA